MSALRRCASLLAAATVVATLAAPTARAGLLVTANDDAYTARHDRVLAVPAPGLLANDTGVARTAAKTSNPAHGTVTVNTNGSFTYQPDAGYVGSDAFGYEARVLNLGILLTDPATVTLTITNAAPTAVNDSYSAATGVTLHVPAPGVIANDTDPDADPLTAVLVDGGGNGSLSLSPDGSFSFKSGGSFTGTRTFTYQVLDGITVSNVATVSIVVSAASPTPTATPRPTPAPTPSPTPRPTPTPAPTLPLPSLPLPSLPLPSLPLPLPSVPVPTLRPTATPSATPTEIPGASSSASPVRSPSPSSDASRPAPPGGSSGPPTSGSGVTTGGTTAGGGGPGGSAPGGAPDGFTVGPPGRSPVDGLGPVDLTGFGGAIDWVVPSLVLSVPGLLVVIAVVAQLIGGAAWVPLVRRWLGEFGLRRRRRREAATPP